MLGRRRYVVLKLDEEWIHRALDAGGREALLTLQFLVHCRNLAQKNPFRVQYNQASLFGINDRRTIKRYLPMLEGYGLVSIQYFEHAAPIVTLLGDTLRPPASPLRTV